MTWAGHSRAAGWLFAFERATPALIAASLLRRAANRGKSTRDTDETTFVLHWLSAVESGALTALSELARLSIAWSGWRARVANRRVNSRLPVLVDLLPPCRPSRP